VTKHEAGKDKAAVDRAYLDMQGSKTMRALDTEPFCVFVFTPTAEGAYSRMFAPEYGISEDPATGSSIGPLGACMMRHAPSGTRRIIEQGTRMGRRSILHLLIDGESGCNGIEVGGYVASVATGTMIL
jgi:trans-2,3-dihydro-3-hydroxyanthranilate isomerase